MIRKSVTKRALHDPNQTTEDRTYWLSQSPERRIEAVEILRRRMYRYAVDMPIQKRASVLDNPWD